MHSWYRFLINFQKSMRGVVSIAPRRAGNQHPNIKSGQGLILYKRRKDTFFFVLDFGLWDGTLLAHHAAHGTVTLPII